MQLAIVYTRISPLSDAFIKLGRKGRMKELILAKVMKLSKQAVVRVVFIRATEKSEQREKF